MQYQDATLAVATKGVLEKTLESNDGGVIAIDRAGNIIMEFNTRGMSRAMADSSGKSRVFWLDE
jgi:beta-aspartyl-peptidase (threonine type)